MTEITANGMTCTSCATHVKDALEKIPGDDFGTGYSRPKKSALPSTKG